MIGGKVGGKRRNHAQPCGDVDEFVIVVFPTERLVLLKRANFFFIYSFYKRIYLYDALGQPVASRPGPLHPDVNVASPITVD